MSLGVPTGILVRDRLAARDLRRNLTAMLERRLPAGDVDDVAQTVLADALAAERVPQDPVEMRRWLAGIARHKVADFHRARARNEKRTSPLDAEDADEPACPPPPLEAREVLASVLDETESPRDRETLAWLVREHHGDRLADIAKEAGLPSPVVRQRVSRLRRALRQRWASALVLLVAAGGAFAGARWAGGDETSAIAPDPSVAPAPLVAPAAAPSSPFDGAWKVESITPHVALTPAQRTLLDAQAKAATVKVQGTRIELSAPAGTLVVTAKDVVKDKKTGAISATVVTAGGASQRVRILPEGARVRVTIPSGRFAGEAVLSR
jgi:DNA-directed RNA polymerase specialized sigma24 family protein